MVTFSPEVSRSHARYFRASVASRVSYQPDPFIEGIIHAWATRFDTPRAQAMGFKADADFRAVVEAFIEDELGGFVA